MILTELELSLEASDDLILGLLPGSQGASWDTSDPYYDGMDPYELMAQWGLEGKGL